MRKVLCGLTVFSVAFAGVVFAADTPDIETIMKKVNGKNGLHKAVAKGLEEASPKWDDLAKSMKDYKTYADALGKNECPKGEKASWEKLSKAYAANAKKLQDAIDKKDKAAAKEAHGAISKSCKGCHDNHK